MTVRIPVGPRRFAKLPPFGDLGVDDGPLGEAVAQLQKIAAVVQKASVDFRQAQDAVSEAKRADQVALAEALQAGRKDPGDKRVAAASEALEAAERVTNAAFFAQSQAQQRVREAFDGHRAEMLVQAESRQSEAVDEFVEALAAARKACRKADELAALVDWLSQDEITNYVPQSLSVRLPTGTSGLAARAVLLDELSGQARAAASKPKVGIWEAAPGREGFVAPLDGSAAVVGG
ncbi:MAG TPA: hypothetical protein PKE32_05345 [Miltoncostaeaceae bacterium]|nr:hypothetical protein [Miltoncostaeaceae bacterium]